MVPVAQPQYTSDGCVHCGRCGFKRRCQQEILQNVHVERNPAMTDPYYLGAWIVIIVINLALDGRLKWMN